MITPQTLKGFRDFLPPEAIKRDWLAGKIVQVFQQFGFDPVQTPALEYAKVLLGKNGPEADKLLYQFQDHGKRQVALRYDQTVPIARVVANYQNLTRPFRRYQLQNVWRAEKPQQGRFREFLQCDADIFGSSSPVSDAEIITLIYQICINIGFKNFKIMINDRQLFGKTSLEAIRIIDKLGKIGHQEVKKQLKLKGLSPNLLDEIEQNKPTQNLQEIIGFCLALGVDKKHLEFDPTLARGLDYYTSTIFEVIIEGNSAGSVCGGGRYDKLIGIFSGKDTPAVGFAFGFDRLLDAAEKLSLIPISKTNTQVLVTVFSPEFINQSLQTTQDLRKSGKNCEVYPDLKAKLDKQLKYADRKGIPWAVIIGPDEANNQTVVLKNLKTKEQFTLPLSKVISFLH